MPDSDGKLNSEDFDKIKAWFKEKVSNNACPFCGTTQWILPTHLVVAPLSSPPMLWTGAGYPCVLIRCFKCGFLRSHDAIGIGLVPLQKESDEQEVKDGAAS